jgi:hypothetical protein
VLTLDKEKTEIAGLGFTYGGPGQKYGDHRPSGAEGSLKHRIKIAHTR